MESYIDDMLVKRTQTSDHIRDLEEAFDVLHQYHMKLNPTKYIFGMTLRKSLGFLITNQKINANPEKMKVILDMRHASTKKEVQQLTGHITALSQFMSGERC